MRYQHDYSQLNPHIASEVTRKPKAAKIAACVTTFLKREELSGLRCLDLGSSTGVISQTFAGLGARTVGLDIDWGAIRKAAREANQLPAENLPGFLVSDAGFTPFPARSFDLIVCTKVYEHVPDVDLLIPEIERLLAPGGLCFFSGPNKWALIEEHYNLPFLSWIPRGLAHRYVRLAGRGSEYFEKPLSAGALRRKLAHFHIHDLSRQLLTHPERYSMQGQVGKLSRLFRLLPNFAWGLIGRLVPNFNWILTPRE